MQLENSMNISCNYATYVDKSHSHSNFSESNSLLIGAIHNKSLGANLYVSILNFNISDLKLDSIKEVHLFLFIEDIKYTNNSSEDFGLLGSFENVDIPTINWFSFPKTNLTKPLILSIPDKPIGAYIKVDITSIIKSSAKYGMNYNIILIPLNTDLNAIVKLASSGSNNPPYLNIVTYSTDSAELSEISDTETYDKAISENTYEDISNNILDNITFQEFLNKIIINFNSQSDVLSSIKKTLNNNKDYVAIQNMLTSFSDNLENQNSILAFIKNQVSNNERFILIKNLLNKVTELLINQDLKLDSYNSSINNNMISFSKKLANLDSKVEALDGKITNSMENSTDILSSSISSLNSEILKLKSMLYPLTENVEVLKTTIDNLKNDINSQNSNFEETNKSESANFNSINSQLSELSSRLNSLVEIVSSITIEPLN